VMGDHDAKADLPKSARWLSSRLGELAPALANRQVFISKQPRTHAKRLWLISSAIPEDKDGEVFDLIDLMAASDENPNTP
jgi:hypothetical protein